MYFSFLWKNTKYRYSLLRRGLFNFVGEGEKTQGEESFTSPRSLPISQPETKETSAEERDTDMALILRVYMNMCDIYTQVW